MGWMGRLFGRGAQIAPSSPTGHASDTVLKKDESFLDHRKELVRKWKENIRNKVPVTAGNADENTQVRERGYNLQDGIFLHKQQRGKLAGVETIDDHDNRQWAAAGLEGRIVRK